MKKIYMALFSSLVFHAACSTRVNYLGSTYSPTRQIDVYVHEPSINMQYEIIGKGYLSGYSFNHLKKLQKKSIEVAKAKGANAVLIQDQYIPKPGGSIQTTSKVDSVVKGTIAVLHTNIYPTETSDFIIYFLKYK